MKSPRKTILDAKGYEIPLYLDECRLKLDSNENTIGPSPKVIEVLRSVTAEDIKFYPAYGEVLGKLAAYNGVKTSMLLPANGADEVISYVFDTFVEPENTVLTVKPSFAMPKIYAGIIGCEYKEVPYSEKWAFPVDDLIKNIDEKTKLIIITTPNNPTGEAISRENLLKILQAAEGRYVLIDETYVSYAEETFINLIADYPNVLIARSMSKDFALAGLRFGYLIASEENIDYVKRVISPYSVNNLAAKAASAALDDIDHLNYVVSQVKQARKLLFEGLKTLAKIIYPSSGNFLLADFGEKAEFVYKKLLKSGIKVKNFGNAPDLENCLRISVPDVENTKYILESLKLRDLIIFDMDGVLVDTSNSYRAAIRGTYESFAGKPLNAEEVQQAKMRGGLNNDWELTFYLLEKAGINLSFADIIAKFQELYWGKDGNGYILNEKQLLSKKSIVELSKKYDLAIFTGRPKLEAEFVLKNWGIEDYFYPVITMDDPPKGMGKPNPWGVHEILRITSPIRYSEQQGRHSEQGEESSHSTAGTLHYAQDDEFKREIYYLGDTVDDMFAAKQAGVKGIGVLPPQEKSEELKRTLIERGAVNVLENTEDIMQLLKACLN